MPLVCFRPVHLWGDRVISENRIIFTFVAVIVALALTFSIVRDAQAIEVAVSDDSGLSGPDTVTARNYQGVEAIHATWVRTFLWGPYGLAHHSRQALVREINAHGLNVQMTLHWNEWHIHPEKDGFTTAGYLAFIKDAVQRFPTVKRFSILNEPDLSFHTEQRVCGQQTEIGLRYKKAYRIRYHAVKRGLYQRIRSHRKVKTPVTVKVGTAKQVVYLRQRIGKKVYYRRKIRSASVYRARTFVNHVNGCRDWEGGARYRDLFRAAYMTIKSVRPDAQVLAGETSPHAYSRDSALGIPGGFVSSFLCQRPTQGDCRGLTMDGYAHHPYQFSDPKIPSDVNGIGGGIADSCEQVWQLAYARKQGVQTANGSAVPMYYTEFGYATREESKWGAPTEDQTAEWAPEAWEIAKNCGVKENMQYQIGGTPGSNESWDTSIITPDGRFRKVVGTLGAWTAKNGS